MGEQFRDRVNQFIESEEDNTYGFELKEIKGNDIIFNIMDSDVIITVKDPKGVFEVKTDDEGLQEWKQKVNEWCSQGNKDIYEVLEKCTAATGELIVSDDEEEGEGEEESDDDLAFAGDDDDVFTTEEPVQSSNLGYDIKEMEVANKRFAKFLTQTNIKGAVDRLVRDYLELKKSDFKGFKAEPINDDLFKWEVQLFNFDKEVCPEFVVDLERWKKMSGKGYVRLEMTFDEKYPISPPFIRVVEPRFAFRAGRVTIGGSICMELLTPKGWSPVNTLEAIFLQIHFEMSNGKPRLDFTNTRPYTMEEAKSAFIRVARDHNWL